MIAFLANWEEGALIYAHWIDRVQAPVGGYSWRVSPFQLGFLRRFPESVSLGRLAALSEVSMYNSVWMQSQERGSSK